jgi:hypothetical protein
MENIGNLKQQIEVLSKMGLDTSALRRQLDELSGAATKEYNVVQRHDDALDDTSLDDAVIPEPDDNSATIVAAPAIQDTKAQEKELNEDIDEPSERKKIIVAPTIEIHQSAWTLACCYLWLTSKNISERKGVMFNTPRPFQELAHKNLLSEVPDQAEWITWNRIYGCALENFLYSKENIKEYKQALKEVMCSTPPWWREKYLANSEISTMTEE